MKLRTIIATATLSLTAVASLTPTASAAEDCADRQCKIEAANKYLASLVSHDASDVPLHPDAWRQENGGGVMTGGENIRAANESPIMYVITGIHDLRWFVDGDDVMSIYFLDTVAPTYIFERFRVDDDGLITEIDAHFLTDVKGHVLGPDAVATNPQARLDAVFASNHGPAGPVPLTAGNTGDDTVRSGSSAGVREAVEAFLDAMASGDASSVVLADDAVQTINHRVIDDIVANLVAESATIDATGDRIIQVDGDQATVLFHIERAAGRLHAATRVRVVDGAITEIESVCDAAYEAQFSPDRIACA